MIIDNIIWVCIGAFAGFFMGMFAAVVFMANGRDEDDK